MIEEDDAERHQKGMGLPLPLPILLEKNNNITLDDIKSIVEKASTFQNSSKSSKQIREELQEVDKIVQEFVKERSSHLHEERKKIQVGKKPNWKRMNE